MKRFFLLTLASAALLGASAAPVKTYEVKSPDGRLALVLTAGERLSFTVARDGETLVAPSEMALTLSTGEVLGESPRVRSARRRAVSETIDAPLYRQRRFDAAYNELDLRLRGDYGILARAYDDGVCYRFYTERDGELTIVDETAQLNFEGDPSAYIPYSKTEIPMRTSFENTYEYAPLSKFRTQTVAFMPVLVDLGERCYVLYTESDVEAYPGVYLTYDKEAKGFAARFAECPTETSLTKRFQDVVERSADYIARVDGRRSYPWRIVAYAATATELPVNDMVWQTAEASRVADASWVRDGKIAWDWWNNWGVYGVDIKSGINTETYKYFIDFAAANGNEISFTSPGWLPEETLRALGFTQIPSCGACLSNMAIAPDGTVLPCQSWLTGKGLGNLLRTPWPRIWHSHECRAIREESAKMAQRCQLGDTPMQEGCR